MKIFLKYTFSILLCFTLPFLAFLAINLYLNKDNSLNYSQTLCGVQLMGLTQTEAEMQVNNALKKQSEEIRLTLKYSDKEWIFYESDFEVKSNVHTILDNLYKSQRKGNYLQKVKTLNKIKKMGFDSEIAINYVFVNMEQKLDDLIYQINYAPIDAEASYNKQTNSFDISPSQFGIEVDKDALYNDILNGLKFTSNLTVNIKTKKLPPKITEQDLKLATKKQSTFSTYYGASNASRKNNIKVATNTLCGYKVNPGETFSFNNAIGKRSSENGYKEANIIMDGEFVKGVGGGVCQVSSTLYNALLLAGIKVTEVHKHTLPVSYVKPALDAMVSWNTADLKFINTTSLPIFIVCNTDGQNLKFSIHGNTKDSNTTIKTVSEITKIIPAAGDKILPDIEGKYSDKIMFKGEFLRVKPAKDGYHAKSYIETYINGALVSRELIRDCNYEPQMGLVYEGCDTLPEGMSLPPQNSF